MQKLTLYHYWRSTSSWRVRWACALKGVELEYVAVDLLKDEPDSPEHLARNPMGYIPTLEIPQAGGKSVYLSESVAIMEWLEETRPGPRLFPRDPLKRALTRQLVEIINAGTQPLQNLNPQYLYSDDPVKRKQWCQHWIRKGLGAYDQIVQATAGKFSVGDELTAADLCLVPQCYNAGRYEVPLEEFPRVKRIHDLAAEMPEYQASHPDRFKPAS